MAAVALFRGAEHVMEWADEEVLRLAPRDGRGAPVKEMFTEATYAPVQAAMDEAYRFGRRVKLARHGGWFIADPRRDGGGRVFGVATVWVPSHQLVDAPPLEPPLPRSHRVDLAEAVDVR